MIIVSTHKHVFFISDRIRNIKSMSAMLTRLSQTMESLHEMESVKLGAANIDNDGVRALANALKENTTVKAIYLDNNVIGAEGASTLADAIKVNTTVTRINISSNVIGAEGATALADALKVNMSVTTINLRSNGISKSNGVSFDALVARNKRLRCMFLFDARRMLLSLMCADECGVVWPYLLKSGDTDSKVAPDNVDAIRTEFEGVLAERRNRRLQIDSKGEYLASSSHQSFFTNMKLCAACGTEDY
jgi:Ran GTPase-activating protein (RanGAP) involved in mRNA processing and transport